MFAYAIATYLPWALSAVTIAMTYLQGRKHRAAWAVGLAGQAGWTLWVVVTGQWGFAPLNVVLWWLYLRNHLLWNAKAEASQTFGARTGYKTRCEDYSGHD